MSDYVIEAKNVSCKVGYKYLLKDISWQVKAGQRWVVFGMNGSGKTTLLSIIAGFRHYTEGTVEVFGAPLDNDQILSVRRRIGWVSASFFDKYYHLETALMIVLSGKTGGFGLDTELTAKDVRMAKALLGELGVGEHVNHSFAMLSKGQRQSVLLARALLANPEILVLDEPCSGLDIIAREAVLAMVQDLAEHTEMTIIYVTHYTEEILEVFDHTLMLRNGLLYAQGQTEELFTQKRLSDFLNYPVKTERDSRGRLQVTAEVPSRIRTMMEEVRPR